MRKIIMMMITNIAGDDMDESEHNSDMIVDGGRVGKQFASHNTF
jgi:hypothetical protein